MDAFDAIGFDYDGVLADSRSLALTVAQEIADLFGEKKPIKTMHEYRLVFAGLERRYASEPASVDTLRSLHRLLMRARTQLVPIFEPVLSLAERIATEMAVITSGLRGTVLGRVGARLGPSRRVLGHEDGLKEHNLVEWSARRRCLYITDNVNDIKHCRQCGVMVVAVGWGFDDESDLLQAAPDWYVGDVPTLEALLQNLNLLENPKC